MIGLRDRGVVSAFALCSAALLLGHLVACGDDAAGGNPPLPAADASPEVSDAPADTTDGAIDAPTESEAGQLQPCATVNSSVKLGSHVLVLRYLQSGQTVFEQLAGDVPIDLSGGFQIGWEAVTENASTTLVDSKVVALGEKYQASTAALKSAFQVGEWSESLSINPCHSLGSVGGNQSSDQSNCDVSPVRPAHHDAWIAFVKRAAQEFLTRRQGQGAFLVGFGGAEIPRQLWQDPASPDAAKSFVRDPVGYLELGREIQQAVQQVAGGVQVRLRLPSFMSPHLVYLQYEQTQAPTLRFSYTDGDDQLLTRSEVDAALVSRFGAAFTTADLTLAQAKQVLGVDCASDKLCKTVQYVVWVRTVIAAIPTILGKPPATPVAVGLNVYGGNYQVQVPLVDAQSAVRKSLAGKVDAVFFMPEQGSPYSPMLLSESKDQDALLRELAYDLPRATFALLASGLEKVPTRPPVSEKAAWPTFDLYGLTDEQGQNPRPAYYATGQLLRILGSGTLNATLESSRLDGIEAHTLRPAGGGAPTHVLWCTVASSCNVAINGPDLSGVSVTETAISASPQTVKPCAGAGVCTLNLTERATFLTGVNSLQFVANPGGACVL